MKFTLSWLGDHLDTTATAEEIASKLTAIGLELEGLEDPSAGLRDFVIAKIVSARKHPDADKLQVCDVVAGDGSIQVVCGAPNARNGMLGVLARPGTYVPGLDMTIQAGEIRGQRSDGMLCSHKELQLSDDHTGIIELPADAPVGISYATWAGLDDPVFEINLTPNRGDCAGVRGIARDLAAAGLGTLRPNRPGLAGGKGKSPISVRIETDPQLCPVFVYRIIRGVKNGESPAWLQQRLRAIGLRPISALVDVTNLMTIDQCRPMHVFDVARLEGDLVIRDARDGEKLQALNDKEYDLGPGMIVISDAEGPVSLAGIMGGEATGCTGSTTDVLVESALWCPSNIARTGRRLDLHSDARFRFERGTDSQAVIEGMEIASQWIVDFCGGELGEIQIAGKVPVFDQVEPLRLTQVADWAGVALADEASLKILTDLGFEAATAVNQRQVDIRVPSWRNDIQGEADLIEEITRICGYEAVPAVPLDRQGPLPDRAFEDLALAKGHVRRALAAAGLLEAVTWSFLASDTARLFGELQDALFLENPMSAELDYMRPSLLINLIAAAQRNADRGFPDVQLFEVGTVFAGVAADQQPQCVATVRAGQSSPRHWQQPPRSVNVFDAKRDAEMALAAAGAPVDNLQVIPGGPSYFHPGRSGALALGRNTLAHFGEIHPRVLRAMDVKGAIVGMEVYLAVLPPKRKKSSARPLLTTSNFQPIERDFAFLVDRSVAASDVLRAATAADKQLIVGCSLFDVYEGQGVPDGQKSLAISITIQPRERSLTDAELESLGERVVQQVAKATGGVLRV